jgi:hypothetical protein
MWKAEPEKRALFKPEILIDFTGLSRQNRG